MLFAPRNRHCGTAIAGERRWIAASIVEINPWPVALDRKIYWPSYDNWDVYTFAAERRYPLKLGSPPTSRAELSESQLRRMKKAGNFPQRVPLEPRVGWSASEVEAWIEARKAERASE